MKLASIGLVALLAAMCLSACGRINYDPVARADGGRDLAVPDDMGTVPTIGVTVSPTDGLNTNEGGSTAAFTVVLNTPPTADVRISLSSSNVAEGVVSPTELTFTSANWSALQTVTVTGVDDALVDGDQTFSIVTAPTASEDAQYDGLTVADVSVVNIDDESPGILVNPTSGLSTTEAGGTTMFSVVLQAPPTNDVSLPVASSDTREDTVSTATVVFTSANWNLPQVITVTGVDDALVDGDQIVQIHLGPAVSADTHYDGLTVADTLVTNIDDESARLVVSPTTGLVTTEGGGTATYSVRLGTAPTADVQLAISSSNTDEGTVSPASLTFTSTTWNAPQTVTLTGVDDALVDGNQTYQSTVHVSTSADTAYASLPDVHVSASNTDNESAGVTVSPTSGLTTSESGGTASFTVVLNALPMADVMIALSSDNTSEGDCSPASLTFTTSDWDTPQTVTVSGVDDLVADGSRVYHILTATVASADVRYGSIDPADVSVTNADDDVAAISVSPLAIFAAEGGAPAEFEVVLSSQPTANVTVPVTMADLAQGASTPASVTFTPTDWNVAQTFTVTAVDDAVPDGDFVNTAVTDIAISADGAYAGIDAPDVSVTHTDNELAAVVYAATSVQETTEAGGTGTFTLVLVSEPTANVTVALSSDNVGEGTVSPAMLTFTALNWSLPQTVTVTGVDDLFSDGTVAYHVVTSDTMSLDPAYDGLDVADVDFTNLDNDADPEILVALVSGVITSMEDGPMLATSESGTTATFTLAPATRPRSDVTISITSGALAEGTVSPSSVTFTPANWNIPQTVTVTGVDDFVADWDTYYSIVTGDVVSADTAYNGVSVADVPVVNAVARVIVTPTAGLTTNELGQTANFDVVLGAPPTGSVTFSVTSSDLSEGTVSTASLTFTTANWSVPQTVTVTGVADGVYDRNVAYTILNGTVVSADASYNGIDVDDVSVTNIAMTGYIKAADIQFGGHFGMYVAFSGDGNTLAVHASTCTVGGLNTGCVYIFARIGVLWVQQARLLASNADASDLFGYGALALSDTGDTLVVGSTGESSVATGIGGNQASNAAAFSGAAYVFERTGTSWAQTTYIKASNTDPSDSFGYSVAISADASTIAVGATQEASSATGVGGNQANNSGARGAVYVFVRAGATWSQEAYVKATMFTNPQLFGSSVALSSDGNTLAVGCQNENSGGGASGAVYVLRRVGSAWSHEAFLKASNPNGNDQFGRSVAISADGNTLAVGALYEASNATGVGGNQADNSVMNAGAAYIFSRSGSSWSQDAYIKASNTGANDYFGFAVDLSDDGNTLVVGARGEASNATGIGGNQLDNSKADAGAAYSFTRSLGIWSQAQYIKATNTDSSDSFGWSVAISGSGTTIAVGAWGESSGNVTNELDNSSMSAGAVYLYE